MANAYWTQYGLEDHLGISPARLKQLMGSGELEPVTEGEDDDDHLYFDSDDVERVLGANIDDYPDDEDNEEYESDYSPEVSPELEADLVDLKDQVRRYLRQRMGKPVSKQLADEHREMVIAFCHYMNKQLGIA